MKNRLHPLIERQRARVEQLHRLLLGWADWQRSYRLKLSYPTRSVACSGAGLMSFDDMCSQSDFAMYETIDSAVADMPVMLRAVINFEYGLARVFRFPRDNYAVLLEEACLHLIKVLPGKGVAIED